MKMKALSKSMGRGIGLVLYKNEQQIQVISKPPICGLIAAAASKQEI